MAFTGLKCKCHRRLLYFAAASIDDVKDYSSATAQTAFRNAVKHMCYMVANNSAMQGAAPGSRVYYTTSPWKMGVYALDVVVALVAVCGIVLMVLRASDQKKNPDKYMGAK